MKILDWNIFKYAAYVVIAVLALSGLNSLLSPEPDASTLPTTDSAFSESSELEQTVYNYMEYMAEKDEAFELQHPKVTNLVQTLSPQAYDNAALAYYDTAEDIMTRAYSTIETIYEDIHIPMHEDLLHFLIAQTHDNNDHFFIMTDGGVPEERYEVHDLLTESGHRTEAGWEAIYQAYSNGDIMQLEEGIMLIGDGNILREEALDAMYRGGGYQ